MKPKLNRLKLLREFEKPSDTLKIEIWDNAEVLLFGLNKEKEKDYMKFSSFNEMYTFLIQNYEL